MSRNFPSFLTWRSTLFFFNGLVVLLVLKESYLDLMPFTTVFLPIRIEPMAVRKSNTFLDVSEKPPNSVIAPSLFYAGQ